MNKCEDWLRNLLVEWQCNLCKDKRVLIGLEKLEYNKRVAHAICYVFLRMLGRRLENVSFGYVLPFSNLSYLSVFKSFIVDKLRASLEELISSDFDKFYIHNLAYYDHSRLHLGVYIAYICLFAYNRG